jgi:hypothetical protein
LDIIGDKRICSHLGVRTDLDTGEDYSPCTDHRPLADDHIAKSELILEKFVAKQRGIIADDTFWAECNAFRPEDIRSGLKSPGNSGTSGDTNTPECPVFDAQ